MLCAAPLSALGDCKPNRPRPKVFIDSMGPCAFDPEVLQFAGDPAEQASCLLRPVAKWAKLGPVRTDLPRVLAERVGRATDLPTREALSGHLSKLGLENDFAAHLWLPIMRAHDNHPDMPMARYLVIHDTSGPFLGVNRWPDDIDTNRKINSLAGHRCEDGWESAHVFINRMGAVLLGHELTVPWRATKFEQAIQFGTLLKGLFMHVEMTQPRRGEYRMVRVTRKGKTRYVRRGRKNDVLAPTPGFSLAQYDRLALVYTIASVRADRWLIPAFHAVLDNHILGGHDDPQNFELDKFAASLTRLLEVLRHPKGSVAALEPEQQPAAPRPQ
jgi:hypothetical protein